LNTIATRRDLARVSKTPGRTQRIHFFSDSRARLAIVDLPGYGYARVAKSERARFAAAVERYLRSRESIRGLVLVLDVRREPQSEERMLAEFAAARTLGFVCVATKVDKLGRSDRARRLRALDACGFGPWVPFSAISGEGKDAVVEAILRIAAR
jgi:GTP-binding protein